MADKPKKKNFLNLPRYDGGSAAFREFIGQNLQYPIAAQEAGIEGFVIIEYDILDNGRVVNPRILKSLGYGCDEEALRLVGLLRFEKARNRGVRVKMTTKTRISFILPKLSINYTLAGQDAEATAGQQPAGNEGISYNYTISF